MEKGRIVYKCAGTCDGVSGIPGVCKSKGCSNHGEELVKYCQCKNCSYKTEETGEVCSCESCQPEEV